MAEEIDQIIKFWKDFSDKQKDSQKEEKFKLNPDMAKVKLLAEGELNNEKNHGLKFCPCRMITNRREEDLKLVCPCNFKMQKTWKDKGECWCSLFVRTD